MSLFSTQLQALLERLDMPQRAAAKAACMQAPLFNSYIRGRHRPSPEVLECICRIFEPADRALLVIAHLNDETPLSAKELVTISNNCEGIAIREEPPEEFRGLTKKVADAFRFLIARAHEDIQVQEWITKTVAILRGD